MKRQRPISLAVTSQSVQHASRVPAARMMWKEKKTGSAKYQRESEYQSRSQSKYRTKRAYPSGLFPSRRYCPVLGMKQEHPARPSRTPSKAPQSMAWHGMAYSIILFPDHTRHLLSASYIHYCLSPCQRIRRAEGLQSLSSWSDTAWLLMLVPRCTREVTVQYLLGRVLDEISYGIQAGLDERSPVA